jgi:hypothetical protein
VRRLREMRNTYNMLAGRPEGWRPHAKPTVVEDNIKMYIQEIGLEGLDWTYVAEDRCRWRATSCKHGNETSCSVKGKKFLA